MNDTLICMLFDFRRNCYGFEIAPFHFMQPAAAKFLLSLALGWICWSDMNSHFWCKWGLAPFAGDCNLAGGICPT